MLTARTVVLVLGLVLLGSCSSHDRFDRAYGSSNHEQISDLRLLMNRHGIPYRSTESETGMHKLAYRSADESRVALLRRKLDHQTSVNFKEPEARGYMQKLLTDMNHDFIVSEKPDGIWIKWFPESEQQDKDLSMRVVQYIFDLQAKKAAADCPPSKAPSNSALVTDVRQMQPRAAECGR